MFNFMRVLLASLVLFSAGAFAENYYWIIHGTAGEYPNPRAAMDAFTAGTELIIGKTHRVSDSQINFCTILPLSGGTSHVNCGYGVYRMGDSCPPNTEYNSETGECVPEPTQCESGEKISVNHFFRTGYLVSLPNPVCVMSCEYSSPATDNCVGPFTKGNTVGNSCRVTYTSNGNECSGDSSPPAPDDDLPPDSPPNPDCRTYVNADGSYRVDCNPRPDPENDDCPPGYQKQGETCFRIPPDHPDYDPDKDPNKPPSEGGDDGSGDGEGTGDGSEKGLAKDSSLKDIGTKIDTTNSKLTGIDGKLGASNTLLQGIKDAIGKIPGGGGGNGNGNGDGEGEGEPAAAGLGCAQELECTGDPIQCATLRVNKEQLCQTQITPEVEQEIKAVFEGEENQLEEKEVSFDSVFTDGLNAARWLPSTCPVPESVSVFGRSYSISWQPLCTFASALSTLIVALASIFFIVYLGKGLKGS